MTDNINPDNHTIEFIDAVKKLIEMREKDAAPLPKKLPQFKLKGRLEKGNW